MSESEKWERICDKNCEQRPNFPNCELCDIALEYRRCKNEEQNMTKIIE